MQRFAATLVITLLGLLTEAKAIPLAQPPVPFHFDRNVTESGTILDAVTVYDATITSTEMPIRFGYPSMSDAIPAVRAFALAEPASEVFLLAGLATLAAIRRRSRSQRAGQRTSG